MKILSYQSFSVYANGGGSRILRRMYKGHENQIISLCIDPKEKTSETDIITEFSINIKTTYKWWAKSIIRKAIRWIRNDLFYKINYNRIIKYAQNIDFDVVHVVDHGKYAAVLCDNKLTNKTIWASFHDHYSTTYSTFQNTKKLWERSSRRLVISNEIGMEYRRLFGEKNFELITDGISKDEVSRPLIKLQSPYEIYFAGLLHFDYLPLFEALTNALDILSEKKGYKFKIILRGTPKMKFLNDRSFEVISRPFSLNNTELKQELDAASILYLPIKFSDPNFYLYSLSTKMIGYLGAPGTILYHGPADSAAFNLLNISKSAACCTSMEINDLVFSIENLLANHMEYTSNAKKLALNQFNLEDIQKRFWKNDL